MRKYATPIFQHRHYAAIAKVLSEQTVSRDILDALASMFANDNPNFHAARFHAAARGVPSNARDRRDSNERAVEEAARIMAHGDTEAAIATLGIVGKDRDEWKHEAAQAMRLKR